jgi:cell division protein FtsW
MISFTLFFVAGADLMQFVVAVGLAGAAFVGAIRVFPHAMARIEGFRDFLSDPAGAGYQVQQTLVSLARGGIFGVGPGAGTQKFILPAGHTDGAFAILAEEIGLIGGVAVIVLFALVIWRGILAGVRARDDFGALLALGVTFWLGLQAILNLAVVTAAIPVTGLPLPFISYGGSSLAISLMGIGVMLNVSRDAGLTRRPQPKRS